MKRALIVEDYPDLQQLYKAALEAEGFEVWTAKDGQTALAVADEHEPDVVLLDLLMPRSGGLEFLRAYDLQQHASVKVIVFSNMVSQELLADVKALGVTRYLIKAKYTPKQMVAEVQKVLASS